VFDSSLAGGTWSLATDGYTLYGAYGNLVINSDGSYTYIAKNESASVGHQDTFDYRLMQPDGDTSDSTLTISIVSGIDVLRGLASTNDTITGTSAAEQLEGLSGNDVLTGGSGADTLLGGDGIDTFVFVLGDSVASITGTGASATLSGFDLISDYTAGTGSARGELLTLPGTANIAGAALVDGVDSTAYGVSISSHQISASGVMTFYADNAASTALVIDSDNKLAAAFDYLTHNDLGNAATTVAFKYQTGTSTFDTYVYSQANNTADNTGAFVKLSSLDIAGLTTSSSVLTNNYVYID